MKVTRLSAGNYKIESNGRVFMVQKFKSAYGDWQWIVDTDEKAGWMQAESLKQVKQAVAESK